MPTRENLRIVGAIQIQPERSSVYIGKQGDSLLAVKTSERPNRFQHELSVYRHLMASKTAFDTSSLPFPLLIDTDGTKTIVTEYIPGPKMGDIIFQNTLSLPWKYHLAKKLIESVGYFHEHNIAHLDTHPYNIIYNAEHDRVVLLDFDASLIGRPSLKSIMNDCPRGVFTKKTFYLPNVPGVIVHAPELLQAGVIDGIKADAYNTACTLVQTFWGVEPLLKAAKVSPKALDIDILRQTIQQSLLFFVEQKPLLEALLTNLSEDPSCRTTHSTTMVNLLNELIAHESRQELPLRRMREYLIQTTHGLSLQTTEPVL